MVYLLSVPLDGHVGLAGLKHHAGSRLVLREREGEGEGEGEGNGGGGGGKGKGEDVREGNER